MLKRVGPAKLTLVQSGAADIDVHIRIGPGNEWRGVAAFPAEMVRDAMDWIAIVETPNDLEDLIREFSDARTWGSYQEFRNLNGF
jgi:hypothetical protein